MSFEGRGATAAVLGDKGKAVGSQHRRRLLFEVNTRSAISNDCTSHCFLSLLNFDCASGRRSARLAGIGQVTKVRIT